jgi:DNA-binding LacI/PurR family transcriptional regulator
MSPVRSPNLRPPTLQDVALAAGVSVATVSRHRRGARHFAPELQARIDAAVLSLGYRDNQLARALVTGRTGTVGLVVLDLLNPHFTGLVQGAHRVALQQRMSVAFVDTAESQAPERHLVEALAQRVDGLVISARVAGAARAAGVANAADQIDGSDGATGAEGSGANMDWISALGKPIVFFGRLGLPGWHSVSTDGYVAATLLGHHLAALGHRHVAYLDFVASRWSAERQRGLRDALQASGAQLSVHPLLAPSAAAGEAVAAQVLWGAGAQRPDAVVAYNDLVAIGFMHEAQRLGVQVPQQLSVAGFDDIELARYVSPGLTTVAMNSQALGAMAMQRLLQLIAGESLQPTDETLVPRLMRRGSTAARSLAHSQPATGLAP